MHSICFKSCFIKNMPHTSLTILRIVRSLWIPIVSFYFRNIKSLPFTSEQKIIWRVNVTLNLRVINKSNSMSLTYAPGPCHVHVIESYKQNNCFKYRCHSFLLPYSQHINRLIRKTASL